MCVGQEEHTDMDAITTNLRVFFRDRDHHRLLANVTSKKSPHFGGGVFFSVPYKYYSINARGKF